MGNDGARYKVTELPHMVDATGLLHPHTGEEANISLRRGMGPEPELPATSKESKGLSKSTNPFDVIDEDVHKTNGEEPEVTTRFTFETGHWTLMREVPVWRIFQDDVSKVVYRDEQGYSYATKIMMGFRSPVSHSLIFEELNDEVGRVRDSWNNDYRVLSPREVDALQWKGKLVDVHELEPTAKLGMSSYEGETVAPTTLLID